MIVDKSECHSRFTSIHLFDLVLNLPLFPHMVVYPSLSLALLSNMVIPLQAFFVLVELEEFPSRL